MIVIFVSRLTWMMSKICGSGFDLLRGIIEHLQSEVKGLKQQLRQEKDALWKGAVHKAASVGEIRDNQ